MQSDKITSVFPVLSMIGVYLLWVIMWENGTIGALEKAVYQQQFADGTPLQTVYTGFTAIDHALSTLVAFTYYPTDGTYRNARLLYIDILSTLQTAQLWCLVEGLRLGRSSRVFAMPAIWGLLWNGIGAGVILPLFAYYQLQHPPRDHKIFLRDAKALVPALLLGSYLAPIFAFVPQSLPQDPIRHQIIIIFLQITPVYLTALHYALSRTLGMGAAAGDHRPNPDLPWIRGAFVFAGVASSMGHIYTLAGGLISGEGLRSIYTGVSASQVSTATVERLALGGVVFLEYDCAIINICAVLWGYLLVKEHVHMSAGGVAIGLIAMDAFCGPGATISAVMWWREGNIRRPRSL